MIHTHSHSRGFKFIRVERFALGLVLAWWGCLALAGDKPAYALVIHGGAGTIRKSEMSPEREKLYQQALEQALRIGESVMAGDGSSLDAVVAVIQFLEDSPLFNAGKGAVLTAEGTVELDASVMRGDTLAAGAVASVKHVKNPIALARLVMEKSGHVLLVGEGAEAFAKEQQVAMVDNQYFLTPEREEQLKKMREQQGSGFAPKKYGTVGVVALDKAGNLAAGTSTGGLSNKKFGRVGDSPIIGAGTYANNATCGVSATGQGEYFIRAAVAHDISSLMAYQGKSAQAAADLVIQKKITEMGGLGGVIVMDAKGNVAISFNTEGMYRGYLKAGEQPHIQIYGE